MRVINWIQIISFLIALKSSSLEAEGWGDWSDWNSCSRSCDEGIAKRVKKCQESEDHVCEKDFEIESRICNSMPCYSLNNYVQRCKYIGSYLENHVI